MTTAFKIDNDIPLPPAPPNRNGLAKYPFSTMDVGQSVFIEGLTSARAHAGFGYLRAKQKKFTARSVIENGVKGMRVWRVE